MLDCCNLGFQYWLFPIHYWHEFWINFKMYVFLKNKQTNRCLPHYFGLQWEMLKIECFHMSEIQNKVAICTRFLTPTEHSVARLSAGLDWQPSQQALHYQHTGVFKTEHVAPQNDFYIGIRNLIYIMCPLTRRSFLASKAKSVNLGGGPLFSSVQTTGVSCFMQSLILLL